MQLLMNRLVFHLKEGALRRWSMWNEDKLPSWAIEGGLDSDLRYQIFQSWKKEQSQGVDHPMDVFSNWPLGLVLDLCRKLYDNPNTYTPFFAEPENLLDEIVTTCNELYSSYEDQTSLPKEHHAV